MFKNYEMFVLPKKVTQTFIKVYQGKLNLVRLLSYALKTMERFLILYRIAHMMFLFLYQAIPLALIGTFFCLPIIYFIYALVSGSKRLPYLRAVPILLAAYQSMLGTFLMLMVLPLNKYFPVEVVMHIYSLAPFDFTWYLVLDGFSAPFIFLTSVITFACIIYQSEDKKLDPKTTDLIIFSTHFLVINFFMSGDLFFMFLFFEAVLIPMFLAIGMFGSRINKKDAANKFLFYTIIGSFFFLIAIFYIYLTLGTTRFTAIMEHQFTLPEEVFLFTCCFLAFAVKIPLIPIHIWLPEAHVEAPSFGSVYLAAVILKMGTFGIIKVLLPLFPLV